MSTQLPLNATDFWWLRYICGIALPVGLTAFALYSIISGHSYAPLREPRAIHFVSVHGTQAVTIGVAYLGIALLLFGECYAQYHAKMGFYSNRFSVPGALMLIAGTVWCYWLFIAAN